MTAEYKLEGKVIFVGNANVGKTSLLNALLNRPFQDCIGQTVSAGYEILNTKDSNGDPKRIQLWDTSGQERFQSVASLFFRGASIAVVCFECSDKKSMQNTESWIRSVQEQSSLCRFIFVGTKGDNLSEDESNQILDEADLYFEHYDPLQVIITSSKTGKNIILLKEIIANSVNEYQNDIHIAMKSNAPVQLNNENNNNNNNCC